MNKIPPCDVTVEVSTSSPPTPEQRALLEAIQAAVRKFGVGTARASFRTYFLERKYQPTTTPPRGAKRG